jgi:hypothetical protein
MKLREAKIVKNKLVAVLNDLRRNRIQNSVVSITPGEDPKEYISLQPEEITQKINQIHAELLKINELFRNACNEENEIPLLEGKFSISVLLDRVRFVRQELEYFKIYASRMPKQRDRMSNVDLVSVVTYSIDEYKTKVTLLENEALTLSNIIDELDNAIEIDYTLPENLI